MNQQPPFSPGGSGQFGAFSELTVPEAGRAAVLGAFANRLGAVDAWPGFSVRRTTPGPTRVTLTGTCDRDRAGSPATK